MNTKATSVFKDPDVAETLFTIHDKHVVLPAYKLLMETRFDSCKNRS
jgi:hypothetical protein